MMKNGTKLIDKPAAKAAKPRSADCYKVCFELDCADAKAVYVAGTFNDWKSNYMPLQNKENGSWTMALLMPPGTYEYQFVVDGRWIPDPKAREAMPNPYGGVNSILRVPGEA